MAQHKSPLPKIPGIHQSYLEIKNKYPIGTDLEVINNVRFIKSIERKNEELFCNTDVAMVMSAKGRDVLNKRTWMVFDKEVLTFDAYYKTQVSTHFANYDIKKLKIVYFLVDETIQVNEPLEPNSGMPQGCFVKRQQIPLPGCNQDTGPYYKLTDLNVGKPVIFYGKTLNIIGVDGYTRDFLYKMGENVSDNEPFPDNPYFKYRKEAELDVTPKCKSITIRSAPINDLDGLILRFRGYWDNRYSVDGELHFFDVLYYLVDDTMELLKEIDDNSKVNGISYRTYVKRQKLRKRGPWCAPIGCDVKQEILNSIYKSDSSYYYKMDSHLLSDKDFTPFYHCTDLYIGATLNVFNRYVTLVKCDEFTKIFYRTVYGLENFNAITAPKTQKDIKEEELYRKQQEIILKSQDELLRKKLLKIAGTGIVFGFIIEMITNDPINKERNFMLKFYLDDRSFAVYEFRKTNSGLRGGMFRSKRGFGDNEKKFVFHQLAVGNTIFVNDIQFIITDVDDKTLKYMVNNSSQFPHSNVAILTEKTRQAIEGRYQSLDDFRTKCFQDRELVDRDEFRDALRFDGQLSPHVGVVFAMLHKRLDPFEPVTTQMFRSSVQDALKRAGFMHFEGLLSNFKRRMNKSDREGHIGHVEWTKAMKSSKVPLSSEIIDILLKKFFNDEHGDVNYVDMIKFMDYTANPVEVPKALPREVLFVKPNKVFVKVEEFVDALKPKT